MEIIHMEIQGTQNSQTVLQRTKPKDSHFLIPEPTTKLQQLRPCGTGVRRDTEINRQR